MDTRVAMISIVVENQGDIEKLNQILHEYGSYIIGRMGLTSTALYAKLQEGCSEETD